MRASLLFLVKSIYYIPLIIISSRYTLAATLRTREIIVMLVNIHFIFWPPLSRPLSNAKIQTFFQTPIFFISPPSPAISLERKKRGRRGCLQCAGNLYLANGRFWDILAVFVQKFCISFHPIRHQKRHPVQGIVALVGCQWVGAGWGSA